METIYSHIKSTFIHINIHLSLEIFIFKLLGSYLIDILFLWNGTVVQLQQLNKKLNNCHSTIKSNFKYAKATIELLDTTVFKNKDQDKLLTTAYEKPTDRECFLHYTSAHPKSLINSILYSQSLRLKKIHTESSGLSKNLQLLQESFTSWGFNKKCLDTQYQRLSGIGRNALWAPSQIKKIKIKLHFS